MANEGQVSQIGVLPRVRRRVVLAGHQDKGVFPDGFAAEPLIRRTLTDETDFHLFGGHHFKDIMAVARADVRHELRITVLQDAQSPGQNI